MIPSLTSENPNIASGAATTTSAHATSPQPPPSAWPWTRATTGAGQRVDRLEHVVEAQRVPDVLLE